MRLYCASEKFRSVDSSSLANIRWNKSTGDVSAWKSIFRKGDIGSSAKSIVFYLRPEEVLRTGVYTIACGQNKNYE